MTKDQCPIGTYPDESSRVCNNCDISCESCTGPTFKDCLKCNSSLGYTADSNPGQCNLIKCYDGQYLSFVSNQAICLPCGPRCESCNDGFPTKCTKCKSGFLEFPDDQGTVDCKICNEIPGLMNGKNEFTCQGRKNIEVILLEICGDGKRMGLLECDDGNLIDGDGCSSKCKIEPNFTCIGGNSAKSDTCTFFIPLTMAKSMYMGNNTVFVSFSKPVTFACK